MKVLVIEDDAETATYIAQGLREHGHVVDVGVTGQEGLFLAAGGGHDVLVVDRMLPGLDGLGLVRALRDTGVKAPVLFLTALGGVGDRVRGLFEPERFYGSRDIWTVSLGVRMAAGDAHHRMGRYGVARPEAAVHDMEMHR